MNELKKDYRNAVIIETKENGDDMQTLIVLSIDDSATDNEKVMLIWIASLIDVMLEFGESTEFFTKEQLEKIDAEALKTAQQYTADKLNKVVRPDKDEKVQ